MALVSTKPLT